MCLNHLASLKPLCVLVLISCFVLSTIELRAQSEDATDHAEHYGVKAGINFAELIGADAKAESDHKVGYSAGIYATYPLFKKVLFQPEIIWSLQGEATDNKGRYKISYLNVPLMLKWVEGHFYTELGPQFGFLVINSSSALPPEEQLQDFESFDLSLNLGLGYKLDKDWSVGLRYMQGVTTIVDGKDLKNSVIYLGISYRLF
jgi:hypothetical protein